jgi:predicted phosphodiesterase
VNTKLQILSDLHNEFYGKFIQIPDIANTDADIIILAGDIDKGTNGVGWAIEQSEKLNKPIIYVPGNHEYYGYDIQHNLAEMRWLAEGTEVYVLDNDSITIQGVRILGSTLWTDYNVDPATSQAKAMSIVGQALNDHFLIRYNEAKFSPAHALELHYESLAWLQVELAKEVSTPTVVVTHHGPSIHCQHRDFPLGAISTGFHSALEYLVAEADLWIYGHTHSNLDTVVEGTRLVANQYGYVARDIADDFDPNFIVEV